MVPKVHTLCLSAAVGPPRIAWKAVLPAGAINISILSRSLNSWGGTSAALSLLGGADGAREHREQVGAGIEMA